MNFLYHSPTLAIRGIILYGTSTIYQTIFNMKITIRSGPFSELENACSSKISNQFPDWKGTAQLEPFSKLENDFP
jgi:hypothetical protein